ncbi:MAG: 16S rRNA (uracil(1498)-N(3))-methyltransferase [Deferribacteraceae bacterium]|jgi:16S rRNA (uracil1498-N3)-methyltransferase|nr:16S rRNA (uracil(1498)-N(3))-methyltransferase [Deferribacteraceae bacterium]
MSGLKRLYSDKPKISGENIHLAPEVRRRLADVLRFKEGELFELLTPETLYTCRLTDKLKGVSRIEGGRGVTPPAYTLAACQCILKRGYMDSVIEKYAELGATKIIPVISERSINALPEKTLERYRQIAANAALVSESEFIAEISETVSIKELNAIEGDNILFYGRGNNRAIPKIGGKVQFIIGAEGGFTPSELDTLKQKGFTSVTPFSGILKAETAGTVFCGMLRALMQ